MNFLYRTPQTTKTSPTHTAPAYVDPNSSKLGQIWVRAEQLRASAHRAALRQFGAPYAALAARISQLMWMSSIVLDKYPTAKVFVYTLGLAALVPISVFLVTSLVVFGVAVLAALSGIGFFGGGFLAFSGFLCFLLAFWAAVAYSAVSIVAQAQKKTAVR
ncbi:hypothetical protein HDU88_004487 [Geranomyces variabilis]|nr:hypothetical protein HDU88_004487 [Geranomyces variabilis]